MTIVINKIPLPDDHYSSLVSPEDYFSSFPNDLLLEKLEDKNKLVENPPERDQIFPSRDSKKKEPRQPPEKEKKEKNKEPIPEAEEHEEEKKEEKKEEKEEEKEEEKKGEIDEMLEKIDFSDLENDFRIDQKIKKDRSRSPSRSKSRSRSRSRSESRNPRSRSRKKKEKSDSDKSRSSSRSKSRSDSSRSKSRSRSRSRSRKREKGKEEELDDDDDYTLKLKNLKKFCEKNNVKIEIPEVTEFTPLDKKKSMYKMAMKELSFSQKEKRQRLFLKACFSLTELLYKTVGFKQIDGFAQAQMDEMDSYSKLMMELGERDYMNFGSKFPVEVKLGALILLNSIVFCIFGTTMSKAKKEEKKKGGSPFGMIKMFARMAGFGGKEKKAKPYEGRKMKGPSFTMEE
jgi:hypothetical protein